MEKKIVYMGDYKQRRYPNNILHQQYESYDEGLKAFIEWRRGFFPHDWSQDDEEFAEQDFHHLWNRENLEKVLY